MQSLSDCRDDCPSSAASSSMDGTQKPTCLAQVWY